MQGSLVTTFLYYIAAILRIQGHHSNRRRCCEALPLALFLDIDIDGLIACSWGMKGLRLRKRRFTIEETFWEVLSCLLGGFGEMGFCRGIFGRILPVFGWLENVQAHSILLFSESKIVKTLKWSKLLVKLRRVFLIDSKATVISISTGIK